MRDLNRVNELENDAGKPPVVGDADQEAAIEPVARDAGTLVRSCQQPAAANVVLQASPEAPEAHLADGEGKPLYMLADDEAGTRTTACLGDCAATWQPFDAPELVPGCGLNAREFARFHRVDGPWQIMYKGHPLYTRAAAAAAPEAAVDGLDDKWFLARDYLVFMSRRPTLAPAGQGSFGAHFLTDGFGRALYVCLDDAPGSEDAAPVSSCLGACTEEFPFWPAAHTLRTTRVPSVLAPQDLGSFVRPDGGEQITFRGWPLYHFAREEDVDAHNVTQWRLIDPLTFGLTD